MRFTRGLLICSILCPLSFAFPSKSSNFGNVPFQDLSARELHGNGTLERRKFFDTHPILDPTTHRWIRIALKEMLELVDHITFLPFNRVASIYDLYFDPAHNRDVKRIFIVIADYARTDQPMPLRKGLDYCPTDLYQIRIHADGVHCQPNSLAISNGTGQFWDDSFPWIKICPHAWRAVYKRFNAGIMCDDLGDKLSYRMHFIGSILLHEML